MHTRVLTFVAAMSAPDTVRLRQAGNALAVTLPRDLLDRHGLKKGDTLQLVETPQGVLLTPFDPAFRDAMAVYEDVAARYRDALNELAK